MADFLQLAEQYYNLLDELRVVTKINEHAYTQFPNGFSENLKNRIFVDLQEVMISVTDLTENDYEINENTKNTDIPKLFNPDTPAYRFLQNYMLSGLSKAIKNKKFNYNFESLLASQEIILSFSYIDSFASDIISLIIKKKPEVLRHFNPDIQWKYLVDSAIEKKPLIDSLVDYLSIQTSGKSIKDKHKIFKKIGIKFNPEPEIELMQFGEDIRHLIVHNQGRVNLNFKEKYKEKCPSIGESIKIDYKFSESINLILSDYIYIVCREADLTFK